jgi:sugar lactone lactonase YvrE
MKKQVLFVLAIIIAFCSNGQIITTIAGNGTDGFSGDGGLATAAQINSSNGVAVDASGNIYFAEYTNHRIRKVNRSTGIITTVAGNGGIGHSGDGGLATAAQINYPDGVAIDAAGNIYITEGNTRIRKVNSSTGIITTVAGNGTGGYSGDGGLATAAKLYALYVAVDASGNIYISSDYGYRVRKVNSSTGIITTVAGNGTSGYSGDGGLATAAVLGSVTGVSVDAVGNIYISDYNIIRKVNSSTGIITTVAGNGTSGYSGDGGLATAAQLNRPYGVAVDASGNIYFADHNFLVDCCDIIRKVNSSTGIITTVAGNGTAGYSGDGGLATAAQLNGPYGVAMDASGNIYIGDSDNYRIRKVTNTTSVVEHNKLSSMLVSPNPFNNATLIKLPESVQNAEIVVSDLLGKKVITKKFSGKEYLLEKGTLSPGIYFVQINDEQHQYPVTKIVVQ